VVKAAVVEEAEVGVCQFSNACHSAHWNAQISLVLIGSNTNAVFVSINLTLDYGSWALPQRMSVFELGWINDALHSIHFA